MSAEIEPSNAGPVRILTINRPERRNALAISTVELLRAELDRAEASGDVGAIVLTGAGEHFSAGGDAAAILNVIASDNEAAAAQLMRAFHRMVETLWNSPLPVVAAVSGVAYGGAFNLALCCDLVVCSSDARFCQVFLRRGLAPDLGGAYLLPRLVGLQRATELMLLTDEIDAAKAHELGLVNAVLPDPRATLAHAIDLAARLAEMPRFAVAQTKKLLHGCLGGTFRSALELEASVQAEMLRSDTARRGFQKFHDGK